MLPRATLTATRHVASRVVLADRRGDAEREGQRVGRAPVDLGDVRGVGRRRRPEEAAERVCRRASRGSDARRDGAPGRRPPGTPVRGPRTSSRIRTSPAARRSRRPGERGPCRALRQAAVRRAPGVEARSRCAARRAWRRASGSNDLGLLARRPPRRAGRSSSTRAGGNPGQELRGDTGCGSTRGRRRRPAGASSLEDDLDPGARVAAVVHAGSRRGARDGGPRRAGGPCRDRPRSRPRPGGSSGGRRRRRAARPA